LVLSTTNFDSKKFSENLKPKIFGRKVRKII
jgi:hypothetical protein